MDTGLMNSKVEFYKLAIGAEFVFCGKRYWKEALAMSRDERGWGTIFMGCTVVLTDGPYLPAEVAAKEKPDYGPWTDFINSLGQAMGEADPERQMVDPQGSPGNPS
jgi:hypothetical protein